MADRRKGRKRREDVPEKATCVEFEVARYLRQKLPVKTKMLLNHKVNYFVACRAIDCLLDSPWATKEKSNETLFTSRESVVDFLNTMLKHNFFHRAKKILVTSKECKKKKKDDSSDDGKRKEEESDSKTSKKDRKKDDDDKKKKKKFKLNMHLDQIVLDGNEIYVWIYEPISTKSWILGGIIVVGCIALCLFPLWPQSVRIGVYYLSIAAAGFLVFILSLVILRLLIFAVVWATTLGRHHLWLLPNLTEDVGFFDSFWPLYKYDYHGPKCFAMEKIAQELTGRGDELHCHRASSCNDKLDNEHVKHRFKNETNEITN